MPTLQKWKLTENRSLMYSYACHAPFTIRVKGKNGNGKNDHCKKGHGKNGNCKLGNQ